MSKVAFTAKRLTSLTCPPDKQQVFIWDSTAPGLGLRSTLGGRPAFVFQGTLAGKSVRVTIGGLAAWSIADAQAKARELQRQIDEGHDPRAIKRDALAAQDARTAADAAHAVTVGEAWRVYVEARESHWGELHRADHERLSRAGGVAAARGTRGRGVTIAGPLYPLLALPLHELTAPVIEAWAAREALTRPTAARLAWRLLRAFLAWCAESPDYSAVVSQYNPAKTRKAREALGKPKAKTDALLKEQLSAWFAAVRTLSNPTIAGYLQTLLITGARPGEVRAMRWDDLNAKWRGLTIRDKVEGERVIPLTPYVAQLLHTLPRRSGWVFASTTKKGERITEPNTAHSRACTAAGIDHLTLHGLRRSFASLTEWLEIPAGVVAQIQGHKPSATAEKHYKVRPLDLLRLHHEKIEAWILEQAGVPFVPSAERGKLRAIA